MKKNILGSIFSATIKLLLRRTLVRSGMLLNNVEATKIQGHKGSQTKMFVCLVDVHSILN